MASYSELYALGTDAALLEKVAIACMIAATNILEESVATPYHTQRLKWAREIMRGPDYVAKQLVWGLLAKNSTASVQQIQGTADEVILTLVNDMLDAIIEK